MTTIAWDGETLAADTACVEGLMLVGRISKIGRYQTEQWGEVLAGSAGSAAAGDAWLAWLADGGRGPVTPSPDAERFVILRSGEILVWEPNEPLPLTLAPGAYALGSGAAIALGALAAGAKAGRAVAIAAEIDCHTRAPVEQERFTALH